MNSLKIVFIFAFVIFESTTYSYIIEPQNWVNNWDAIDQKTISNKNYIPKSPILNEDIIDTESKPISKSKITYVKWQRPIVNFYETSENDYDTDGYDSNQQHRRYARQAQDPNKAFQGNLNLAQNPGYGLDLSAAARARLYQSPNQLTSVYGTAQYQRHYGGQFGTGPPNYGVGLQFNRRF